VVSGKIYNNCRFGTERNNVKQLEIGNFKDNICVAPFVPGDEGRLSLSLVGIDCDGARGFVADYYIRDGLLVVLCRRCCVAG
jgi:hypothetical protein